MIHDHLATVSRFITLFIPGRIDCIVGACPACIYPAGIHKEFHISVPGIHGADTIVISRGIILLHIQRIHTIKYGRFCINHHPKLCFRRCHIAVFILRFHNHGVSTGLFQEQRLYQAGRHFAGNVSSGNHKVFQFRRLAQENGNIPNFQLRSHRIPHRNNTQIGHFTNVTGNTIVAHRKAVDGIDPGFIQFHHLIGAAVEQHTAIQRFAQLYCKHFLHPAVVNMTFSGGCVAIFVGNQHLYCYIAITNMVKWCLEGNRIIRQFFHLGNQIFRHHPVPQRHRQIPKLYLGGSRILDRQGHRFFFASMGEHQFLGSHQSQIHIRSQ